MSQECLAVIPARGGSKGIPRKNLQPVGGVPLVTRAVRAALCATTVTRVVVSTDDAEIARVAEAAGAEVVMRPDALASDTASSESALLHVLEHLERSESYRPELLVFLQCTSPLCLPADIDGAVNALLAAGADCCLTVAPFHGFLWRMEGGEAVALGHDSASRPRRQDREPQYLENGAVYVMRAAGFRAVRHRFFGRIVAHAMPAHRSVEVDDPADLALAESLAAHPGLSVDVLPRPVEALVLDFDGVFTDNSVLVLDDGSEGVMVSRGDGLGLSLLRGRLPIMVLSKERNPVVGARCEKLGLEYHQGVDDKAAFLREWLAARGLAPERTVYVGNDLNDLECLALVGCGVAVADAHPEVLRRARFVLAGRGGHGALREVAEMISAGLGLNER